MDDFEIAIHGPGITYYWSSKRLREIANTGNLPNGIIKNGLSTNFGDFMGNNIHFVDETQESLKPYEDEYEWYYLIVLAVLGEFNNKTLRNNSRLVCILIAKDKSGTTKMLQVTCQLASLSHESAKKVLKSLNLQLKNDALQLTYWKDKSVLSKNLTVTCELLSYYSKRKCKVCKRLELGSLLTGSPQIPLEENECNFLKEITSTRKSKNSKYLKVPVDSRGNLLSHNNLNMKAEIPWGAVMKFASDTIDTHLGSKRKNTSQSRVQDVSTLINADVLDVSNSSFDEINIHWESIQGLNRLWSSKQALVPISSDNPDTDSIFRTIETLTSRNVGISAQKSLDHEKDANGDGLIFSTNTSVDLDSVITVQSEMISKDFRREFEQFELPIKQPGNTITVSNAFITEDALSESDYSGGNNFCRHESHRLYSTAYKLVQMTLPYITECEKNLLTPINDNRYLNTFRNKNMSRIPTMGFERSESLYCIPNPANSSDPYHAWILVGSIDFYKDCVRQIAIQLILMWEPANWKDTYRILLESDKYKNDASIPGGLWVYRLAHILYSLTMTDEKIAGENSFISETFNMKTRTMSVPFHDRDGSSRWNTFHKNQNDSAHIQEVTNALVKKIMRNEASIAYSILRYAILGFCDGVVNFGNGLQCEAYKQIKNGNADARTIRMYPAQLSSLKYKDKDQSMPWVMRQEYPVAFLPPGLSGFTEKHTVFTTNKMGVETFEHHQTKINQKRRLNEKVQAQLQSVYCEPQSNSAVPSDESCEAVRCQVYYPFISNAKGGRKEKFEHRASTGLRVSQDSVEAGVEDMIEDDLDAADNNKSDHHTYYESANLTMKANKIYEFAKLTNENLKEALKSLMIRQEVAHIRKVHNKPIPKPDNVDTVMEERVKLMISEPVNNCVELARKNTVFIDVGEVIKFSSLVMNAYIFVYNLCLYTLKQSQGLVSPPEMQCVTYMLKHVQDAFALFYIGNSRPAIYGPEHKKFRYCYKVFLPPIGRKLGRPFTMMCTMPQVLIDNSGISRRKSAKSTFPNIHGKGLQVVQRLKANALQRFRNFMNLQNKGHVKNSLKIFKCRHKECREKFFFSNNLLHAHLRKNKHHKQRKQSPDDGKNEHHDGKKDDTMDCTECTKDVYNWIYNQIQEFIPSCNEPARHALTQMCAGRNLFISGDPGAGKTCLLRKLVKLAFLIYNDWLHRNDDTEYKVVGVTSQNLTASIVSPRFRTIHSFLGYNYYNSSEFDNLKKGLFKGGMIPAYQEYLSKHPEVRKRLRNLEVLFVDEVGTVEDVLGRLMMNLIKVARGQCDQQSHTAHSGIYYNEEKKLPEIQLIVTGQVTQTQPISDQPISSWAMTRELNDMVEPIYLNTLYRSEGDKLLQELIKKIHYGKLDDQGMQELINAVTAADNEALEMYNSPFLQKNLKVTSLAYLLKDVWHGNKQLIDKWKMKHTNKLQSVRSINELHPEDPNRNRVNPSCQSIKVSSDGKFVVEVKTFKGTKTYHIESIPEKGQVLHKEDITLDTFCDNIYELWLCKEMRVIISKNSFGYENCTDLKSRIRIAKGSIGTIKEFITNDNTKVIEKIGVSLLVPSEEGISTDPDENDYKTLYFQRDYTTYKRVNVIPLDLDDKNAKTVVGKLTRQQFPFKYAAVVSWSTIQGMTIPYLHLSLSGSNKMLYNHHRADTFYGLFFVTISRVKNLKHLSIEFPNNMTDCDKTRNDIKKFINCVSMEAINFEKDFKGRAASFLEDALHRRNLVNATFETSHHLAQYVKEIENQFNYNQVGEDKKLMEDINTQIIVLTEAVYTSLNDGTEKTLRMYANVDEASGRERVIAIEHLTGRVLDALQEGNKIREKINNKLENPRKKLKLICGSSRVGLREYLECFDDLASFCKTIYSDCSEASANLKFCLFTKDEIPTLKNQWDGLAQRSIIDKLYELYIKKPESK